MPCSRRFITLMPFTPCPLLLSARLAASGTSHDVKARTESRRASNRMGASYP